MGEADKIRDTAADRPVATPPEAPGGSLDEVHAKANEAAAKAEAKLIEERAEGAKIDEELDKLEKEAFPERPEPVHVDQAIGT